MRPPLRLTPHQLAILFSFLTTFWTQALVVNLDVEPSADNTFSGQGAHSDPDHDFWNSSASTLTNLLASDGLTPTTIDVTISAGSRYDATGDNVPAGQSHSSLVGDYSYARNADTSVGITGLTPNGQYLLYLYAQGDNLSQNSTITFGGQTKSTSGLLDGSISENANYVVMAATADSNGELSGTVARNGSSYSVLNGLQIVELSANTSPLDFVVNVDLGGNETTTTPYSGQGAFADPGNDYWNNTFSTDSRSLKGLTASDGSTLTPVRLDLSGGSGFFDSGKNNNLLNDYFYNSTISLLRGLSPGAQYTLYVYAAGDRSGQGSAITVNGVTKTTSNSGNPGSFSLGVNYQTFTTTADIAGRIAIDSSAKLNGFQLITGSPPASPHQAENAAFTGLNPITSPAAFAGQALDGFDAAGDSVEYSNLPAGDTLQITYANGATTTRLSLYQNGVDLDTVYFPPTGSWTDFRTLTHTGLTLASNSSVKLQLDADDLAFNNGQNGAVQDQIEVEIRDGQIVVSSVLELLAQIGKDDVDVKMTPGVYEIDETDQESGLLPLPILFDFCGSNSSYDFTGVEFQIYTNLYNEWPGQEVRVFEFNGSNNHFYGLTQKDIGNEAINSVGVLNMAVVGDANKVEEFSLYTRGSRPYGYGDLFGKGSGAVIGHDKHAALLVNGANCHLLNCYLELASYGHGIFMQGAIGTLVEGCFVKGDTFNTTDNVLAEEGTGSEADQVDFMTVWGWEVPPGYAFSLQEDGIRCYNSGANGLNTANTTVRNCTVENMRSGVVIGFSDGDNEIFGCTTISVEGSFWPGNGDSVEHCQGEAPYQGMVDTPYQNDSNQDYSVTLLQETDPYGNDLIAYFAGSGHDITFWNSALQPTPNSQTIQMGGLKTGLRHYDGSTTYTLSNTSLTNWTDQAVALPGNSSNNSISSFGTVSNAGSGNTVSTISPATVSASMTSSGSAAATLDGNGSTFWSADGLGEWIQYDLGTSRNLYQASVQWLNGNTLQYDFEIQVSNSSSGPWTNVFSGTSTGSIGFEEYNFPTQNARYLRVVGQGNSLDEKIQIVDFDLDLKDRFAMVKAKSEAGTNFISQNTLDGDLATRWSAEGVGQWIQYDLLERKQINGLALAWHNGSSLSYDFEVGVSDHPMGPFTSIYTGTSSSSTNSLESYAITPAEARFIRITGERNSVDNWTNITEAFLDTETLVEVELAPTPLACWLLDEGQGALLADFSGNGYQGSLGAAPISNPTWSVGAEGNGGLSFDGSASSATLPVAAFTNLSDEISLSFWAYGGASLPRDSSVIRALDASGNRILNIHLPWGNGQVYWDAGDGSGYDRINKQAAAAEFSGSWNHWVFTKNATQGSMQIYLNGNLWHSGTGKARSLSAISTVFLGSDGGTVTFEGSLDNIVLYDEALTLAQVNDLYQGSTFAYLDWVEQQGLSSSDTSWTGDLDKDQWPNLLEYALGSNALTSQDGSLFLKEELLESEFTFEFSYRRRLDAAERGLNYLVKGTSELSDPNSWTTEGILETSTIPIDEVFEWVTVQTDIGIRKFLRLEVTMDSGK
ncbi:discoidin domain-containing protein [Roseibacillus persicicus]|uniref:discoidin domain-containing protein n=1 Tax=Roseibacillus persicicus TaxID=454148 RepID=UPI00398ACA76